MTTPIFTPGAAPNVLGTISNSNLWLSAQGATPPPSLGSGASAWGSNAADWGASAAQYGASGGFSAVQSDFAGSLASMGSIMAALNPQQTSSSQGLVAGISNASLGGLSQSLQSLLGVFGKTPVVGALANSSAGVLPPSGALGYIFQTGWQPGG
jgi:hypothetical protein